MSATSALEQLITWNALPGQDDKYVAPQARAELTALEQAVNEAREIVTLVALVSTDARLLAMCKEWLKTHPEALPNKV